MVECIFVASFKHCVLVLFAEQISAVVGFTVLSSRTQLTGGLFRGHPSGTTEAEMWLTFFSNPTHFKA